MYIKDQQEYVIHDARFIQRFHIVKKPDAWLIISSIEHDRTPRHIRQIFHRSGSKRSTRTVVQSVNQWGQFF